MSTPQDPGRAAASPALTSLPRVEDLPQAPGGGYDADRVRDAFDAFRRHSAQLQAQLRVLQAASRTGSVEPTGHAVRMDALHLIRSAAEFADTLESDAQQASSNQLARTEEEVSQASARAARPRGRDRALPPGVRAPAGRDHERRTQRGARAAPERTARRVPGGSRVRGARHPARRAGTPSGDRAHERRPRRSRADARVGPRPGRHDHGPRAAGSRAVPGLGRSRRIRDRTRRRVDRPRRRPRVRELAGSPARCRRRSPTPLQPSGPIPVRPSSRKPDDEPASPKTPPADDGEREEPKP